MPRYFSIKGMALLKKLDSTQRRKDTKDAEYHKLFPSILKVYHILASLRLGDLALSFFSVDSRDGGAKVAEAV